MELTSMGMEKDFKECKDMCKEILRSKTMLNCETKLLHSSTHKPMEDKFSLYDFKAHLNCTYFQYGKIQIKQIVKYCEVCDPNHGEPMCQDCMEACHKTCNKNMNESPEDEEKKEELSQSIFTCECGRRKHEIENTGDSAVPSDKKCCLLELDSKLRNKMLYWCDNCNVNVLCFICYSHCHSNPRCKILRKKRESIEGSSSESALQCECTHANHSSIFPVNTFINFQLTNGKFVYDTIPFIWKLQIINCLFDSEVPMKLFFPVDNYFKNFCTSSSEMRKFDDLFKNIMSRVTNNIYTNLSIVYFNYHPKIVAMFPYEKLTALLHKFKDRGLYENSDLIKSILHIILYVHYKRDFQNLKNYCTFDFMVSSTSDRLLLRNFLHTESIYTKDLHEKYYNKTTGKFTLAEFTNFVAKLFEKACDEYKKFGLSKCLDNYFICLKIIFFNMKRMTFDLESLSEFISIFEKISLIFHGKLKDIVNRFKEMKVKNDHTYNWWILEKNVYRIMTVITKITYLVTINYNDLITLDLLREDNPSKLQFIHSNSEHSNKLFKILINTSMFYSTFIMNNDIYNKENAETNSNPTPGIKFLNTFNETMELFTVTDNLFFKGLEKTNLRELHRCYNVLSNQKVLESHYNVSTANVSHEIQNGFGGSEKNSVKELIIENKLRNNDIADVNANESPFLVFKKLVFDLKQKCEGGIDLFFCYKISLAQLNEEVRFYIEEFGRESIHINSSTEEHKEYIEQGDLIFHIKITKYKKKILRKNKEIFKFLPDIESNIELLIQELVLSSIDTTLTKLFMTDFKLLRYPLGTVNAIFSFLSLFLLSKEGLKYFCLGRNLRRVIKIFEKFPKRTMEFLCLVFQGVDLYDIDLSYHKRLNELMITIRNHIKSFVVSDKSQEKEFKEFLTYTIKFLHSLNKNFNIEEMMVIQQQIFDYVDERKLLTKEKIINSFSINSNSGEDDRQINLDYAREIFEKEKRVNRNKMPGRNNSLSNSGKLVQSERVSERGDILVEDYASLLPKKKRARNKGNSHSILNFNFSLYYENRPESEHENEKYYNNDNNDNNDYIHDVANNGINADVDIGKTPSVEKKSSSKSNNAYLENDHKFLFAFFKLIANFTHYFVKNDDTANFPNIHSIFSVINGFNDLDFYKCLLNKNYLTLKHRTSLLIFLRSIYFTDILNSKSFSQEQKYFGSDKFYKYNKIYKDYMSSVINNSAQSDKKTQSNPKFKEFEEKGFITRMENLGYMKSIIEIFIQEVHNFVLFIFLEKEDTERVKEYIEELLFSVKIISDVFVTYDISSQMTLSFYELVKEFLKKEQILANFLNYLKEKGKIDQVDLNEGHNELVAVMERKDFEIYDNELIYSFLLEGFNKICKNTKLNEDFKLETFMRNYLVSKDRNFKVFFLNNKDNLLESFLNERRELSAPIQVVNICRPISSTILETYLNQFLDIYNTTFHNVLYNSSNDMDINYRQIFFDFCISYVFHMEKVSSENLTSVILTINKLLIYDTKNSQLDIKKILIKNSMEETFFKKYSERLNQVLNLNMALSKSFLIHSQYREINFTSKLMIQFIQLLGEGHNKEFLSRIVSGKGERHEEKHDSQVERKTSFEPYELTIQLFKTHLKKQIMNKVEQEDEKEDNHSHILYVLVNTLKVSVEKVYIRKNFREGYEMPYDKLIVLIGNIVDCLVEFLQGVSRRHFLKMYEVIKKVLPILKSFMFCKKDLDEESNAEMENYNLIHDIPTTRKKVFIVVKIYIIQLLTSLIQDGNSDASSKSRNEIVSSFQPLDLFEELLLNFREIIAECKKAKKLKMKLDFENDKMNEKILSKLLELYIYDSEFNNSLQFKYSLNIFYFLKFLAEVHHNQHVVKLFDDLEHTDNNNDVNKSKVLILNSTIIMHKFYSELLKKIEIRSEADGLTQEFTYFVIPPICFLLTNQTMKSFVNNVDRESTHSKILSLISETDYFIYEMFYNRRMIRDVSHSFFTRSLYNINLFNCEMINYALIVIQNVVLLIDFYKDPASEISFTEEEKYAIHTDNMIISIMQLCFLIFLLVSWMKYKFYLYNQHNLMRLYNKRFIIRKKEEEISIGSVDKLMDNFTSDVGWKDKFKVGFADTILGNKEVNIFVFTFFLIILYFFTKCSIFLVIPILFAYNLNSILFGIIEAVRIRWVQMASILFYTYLVVYFFSWIAFYFYTESYNMEDSINTLDGSKSTENFCTNPIQCYLVNLDYGVRSGGGIGDVLDKISYKNNIWYFISRFFYDISFHIIIIWIMSNLFFGIIVDTFADLRDKNTRIENDKNNVCFICQINKDNAMNSNIDFNKHILTDHYLWNYVYFITYLHINNPNDFKYLETYVWEKIHLKDTSWIPIHEASDDSKSE